MALMRRPLASLALVYCGSHGEPPCGRRLAREIGRRGPVRQGGHKEPGVVTPHLADRSNPPGPWIQEVGRHRQSPVAKEITEPNTSSLHIRHEGSHVENARRRIGQQHAGLLERLADGRSDERSRHKRVAPETQGETVW